MIDCECSAELYQGVCDEMWAGCVFCKQKLKTGGGLARDQEKISARFLPPPRLAGFSLGSSVTAECFKLFFLFFFLPRVSPHFFSLSVSYLFVRKHKGRFI